VTQGPLSQSPVSRWLLARVPNRYARPLHEGAARLARRDASRLATLGVTAWNATAPAVIAGREPERALDVLRPPAYAGRPGAWKEAVAQRREAGAGDDLAAAVASVDWYHTIELPGGVVTPGFYDHRELVSGYGLPEGMDGLRVLDVGTFDGFWAFEMERRGAEVEALDIGWSTDIDLPPAARMVAEREDITVAWGRGFEIAARALGSSVRRHVLSVYDLGESGLGPFDLVHLGDLLLHLERPWAALRAIRQVTRGELHIADVYNPALKGVVALYRGGWQDCQWWTPSLDCLAQWVIDAGFRDVRLLRTYPLDPKPGYGANRRAVFRGRA
jgi:tRNA (mo5U34)-methyltransferase